MFEQMEEIIQFFKKIMSDWGVMSWIRSNKVRAIVQPIAFLVNLCLAIAFVTDPNWINFSFATKLALLIVFTAITEGIELIRNLDTYLAQEQTQEETPPQPPSAP